MKLAVVHDLAEALAGDIAPFQKVSKEEKRRLEEEGLEKITATIGSDPIGGCAGLYVTGPCLQHDVYTLECAWSTSALRSARRSVCKPLFAAYSSCAVESKAARINSRMVWIACPYSGPGERS